MSNQIETQIDVSLTERDRLTALFRLIIALPALIFTASFAPSTEIFSDNWGFFAAGLLTLPAGLAILFRQIYPSYVLTLNEALLSLQTRVDAYLLLLTDEYPSIEENDVVSVSFPDIDARQLNRWLPLIKWLLALPLYLVGIIYIIYAGGLTLIAWISILFTGNYPEFCAEGVVGTIAYWNRVIGYAFILVTDEYPTFSL